MEAAKSEAQTSKHSSPHSSKHASAHAGTYAGTDAGKDAWADSGAEPWVRTPQARELARCVVGVCASTDYRLAATDSWGDEALQLLYQACADIKAAANRLNMAVKPPPSAPPGTPLVARCVMLNQFLWRLRKQCQAMLAA